MDGEADETPLLEGDAQFDRPSKSQLKRDAAAVLNLGQQLSALSDNDLETIPLEDSVRTAVVKLQKTKSFGARKRQLHYLAKLLRNCELEPVQHALSNLQSSAIKQKQLFHMAERWRDKILHNTEEAINEFVQKYPNAERQRLRQLARNHKRELQQRNERTETDRGTKSSREIFQSVWEQVSCEEQC